MKIAIIAGVGSGLGALARIGLDSGFYALLGPHFPWGILLVNIFGSFLAGHLFFTHWIVMDPDPKQARKHFLITGFCGGFTTFSFFSLQTFLLADEGRMIAATVYSLLTLLLCMAAVFCGSRSMRRR